jgi:hypothetical protein
LARIFVSQKKLDRAREQYFAFFAAWKNADADLPLMIQARRESESLVSGRP